MKEKLMKFMYGRYGVDQFSKFLTGFVLAALILNIFFRSTIFYVLGLGALIYSYYRIFSKNHQKRFKENQIFLKYSGSVTKIFSREKNLMAQRKTHHIYKCPQCKQKIRIPKGKGKIWVTCPSCKMEFVKKS